MSEIYMGPQEGVKVSWNIREIKEELADICGFETTEGSPNKMTQYQIDPILQYLDIDPQEVSDRDNQVRAKMQRLADEAGFTWTSKFSANAFKKDEMWEVLQHVKDHQTGENP